MNIETELNNLVESIRNDLELGYQKKSAIVSLHYDQIIKLRKLGVPLTVVQKRIGNNLLTISYLQNVVSKLSSKGPKRSTVNTEMHIDREQVSLVETSNRHAENLSPTQNDESAFMNEWNACHSFDATHAQVKDMIALGITPQDIQAANITKAFDLVKYISNKKNQRN